MTRLFVPAVMVLAGWLCASPAIAQMDDLGHGEFSAYFGPAFGAGSSNAPADIAQGDLRSPGFGTHAVVGAATGASWGNWTAASIDVSFMPMGSDTLRPLAPLADLKNSYLYDFSLNFRIGPRRSGKRLAPYGIVGGGLLYATYKALESRREGVEYKSRTTTNFGFNTGGGVSYYLGENWGIRPEVKVCISTRTFVQVSFGVFATVSDLDWFRHGGLSSRRGL